MVALIPQNVISSTPSFIKGKVGSAYLESSCLRKLLRPLSIPAKMVITYNVVSSLALQEQIASSPSSTIKRYKKKNKDVVILANKKNLSSISSSSSLL